MLATEAIFPYLAELGAWEMLAGYLLYDHSSISASPDDADLNLAIQGTYKLANGEEPVLLDVLYFSVKMHLASLSEVQHSNKTNASKNEARKKQETAAHNLSTIIPQLLSRYGSTPQAATSILRLEQLLDVGLINDLQSGEGNGSYTAILDDINKQFLTHSDRKVLAEASKALRTARGYEQSKEAADAKVREIWDDSSATLFSLLKGKNLETRGTLDWGTLRQITDICVRCSNLASIGDCSEVLEARTTSRKGKGRAHDPDSLLRLFMQLVKRGVPDEETTLAFADAEDQLCIAVVNVLSFYFRWKVVAIKSDVEKNNGQTLADLSTRTLASLKVDFVEHLTPVISSRLPLDVVRVQALLTALDLHILFATVKNFRAKPGTGELDDEIKAKLQTLTEQTNTELWTEVMLTIERMEKSLASKTNRKIEVMSKKEKRKAAKAAAEPREETQEEIEAPPEDSDDENADIVDDEDDSGDEGDGEAEVAGKGREAKKQAALLAEQALCEMASKVVLAVIAGVAPDGQSERVKERLRLNRTKLGKSYALVVAYLDEKKQKDKKKGADPEGKPGTPQKKATGSGGGAGSGMRKGKERAVDRPEPMEIEGDEIEDGIENENPEDEIEDDEEGGEEEGEELHGNDEIDGEVEGDDEIMGD
jgi:cohesin complex subunit SA-1/2